VIAERHFSVALVALLYPTGQQQENTNNNNNNTAITITITTTTTTTRYIYKILLLSKLMQLSCYYLIATHLKVDLITCQFEREKSAIKFESISIEFSQVSQVNRQNNV